MSEPTQRNLSPYKKNKTGSTEVWIKSASLAKLKLNEIKLIFYFLMGCDVGEAIPTGFAVVCDTCEARIFFTCKL